MHVLVLVDMEYGPAKIVHVGENHNVMPVSALGEVNMGSTRTLRNFVSFAKDKYPAERYLISFYDHGGGWRGCCWDGTSTNDNLTMDEMGSALCGAGGVDLVLFSAPCLMGAFESAYELRSCTNVYVASEATNGYAWWFDPMGDLSETLHNTPGISNEDLGAFVIASIWDHRSRWSDRDWAESLTMSAVRSNGLEAIEDQLDSLSALYIGGAERLRAHLDSIRVHITSFGSGAVDLYDFAAELLNVELDDHIRTVLVGLQDAIENAVIADVHGGVWHDVHGRTVYLPDASSASNMDTYVSPSYCLDLISDTRWPELLDSIAAYFPSPSRNAHISGPPLGNGFSVRR